MQSTAVRCCEGAAMGKAVLVSGGNLSQTKWQHVQWGAAQFTCWLPLAAPLHSLGYGKPNKLRARGLFQNSPCFTAFSGYKWETVGCTALRGLAWPGHAMPSHLFPSDGRGSHRGSCLICINGCLHKHTAPVTSWARGSKYISDSILWRALLNAWERRGFFVFCLSAFHVIIVTWLMFSVFFISTLLFA